MQIAYLGNADCFQKKNKQTVIFVKTKLFYSYYSFHFIENRYICGKDFAKRFSEESKEFFGDLYIQVQTHTHIFA